MSTAEILAELPRLTEAERALILAKLREFVEPDMDRHPLTGLPILRLPAGTATITSEDVRHAIDEDE
jgi:hypothetical protein